MKIAIGAVAGTVGGPATYAVELVRSLVEEFPDDEFVVLTDQPQAFAAFADVREVRLRSPWEQPLWDHVRVPSALARERFDLYHGTKGVVPRRLTIPAVVTIHDLANYVLPSSFGWPQRFHLRWETPKALRRARAVIVPSRSTAADVARFFPEASARVRVIAEAPSPRIHPASAADIAAWRGRRGIERPACGYLGTVQPRKNIDLLVEAFLRAAGTRDWRLVIAGRMRPGYRPAFRAPGADARIVYLGPLEDEELSAFFGSMRCMVSPSAYEGFGLTVLEAMAAGCPVVALRNSSLPEVAGDAGVLLERPDAGELAQWIERLMTDDRTVADLSRRGRAHAVRFSWKDAAQRTRAVYETAAGSLAAGDAA
ncbi:MAG TPA: glycosyltransferase family 1 protein [Candidatus Limnocylindrales bacterium]|nr:glycosyltransferase family 1 protein [Candidatus Limnocylindrales bacterium]